MAKVEDGSQFFSYRWSRRYRGYRSTLPGNSKPPSFSKRDILKIAVALGAAAGAIVAGKKLSDK